MSVKKLYNKDAYADNMLVIHSNESGCCGSAQDTCRYTVDLAITNVTNITINNADGDPIVVTFAAAANTPKEIRVAIAAALRTQGFDPYYEDSWKSIIVTATTIKIIGEADLVSITVNGVDTNFVKWCTTGRVCPISGTVDTDTDFGLLHLDGSAGTQVGPTPAGFPTGQAATVKTALEGALTTEGSDWKIVTVTEDLVNGAYKFTMEVAGSRDLALDADPNLVISGCYPDFISA